MVLWDSLFSFFHTLFFSAHTHTLSLSSTSILSLSLSLASILLSSDIPPSFSKPYFHLLFLIPASGHPLTAMMTSFSGLRGVSLLASLYGSLWWPGYGSQSSQCNACEAVFNMTISLRSPQVVDWIGVFALFTIHTFLYASYFFWSLLRLICFSFLRFVSLFLNLVPFHLSPTGCI